MFVFCVSVSYYSVFIHMIDLLLFVYLAGQESCVRLAEEDFAAVPR